MLQVISRPLCLILSIFLVFLLNGCSSSNCSNEEGPAPLDLTTEVSTLAGTAGVSGSDDGVGTDARFERPRGIATDGTNLYVTDRENETIRQIVIATGEVTTLAGTAQEYGADDGFGPDARFNEPSGIVIVGDDLYVSDKLGHKIRKIVIATGEVTTFAGGTVIALPYPHTYGPDDGIGTAAQFDEPHEIATDGTNLYVADSNNNTIRKIVIATAEVTTLAGTAGSRGATDGIGSNARFSAPRGIFLVGNNLYVADRYNHAIRKIVVATGEVTTFAGTIGVSGAADGIGTAASFNRPIGLTSDGTNLYVADEQNHMIRMIEIKTATVTTIAGDGTIGSADNDLGTLSTFYEPSGLATDGMSLFVADQKNNTIREIQ
ncbi:MAG: hypothetical protein KKF30_00845 [Proteobacteria bacterium]|nr:hypothetical protein [Pseudomonadota bacterium]MBU4471658.1 hypothetical protein [Pseudomonadota bacterium]MCG2751139.1 hypothetical protein [Desulfobacteraceae bacterium]